MRTAAGVTVQHSLQLYEQMNVSVCWVPREGRPKLSTA